MLVRSDSSASSTSTSERQVPEILDIKGCSRGAPDYQAASRIEGSCATTFQGRS
jgi:hypothetical protein